MRVEEGKVFPYSISGSNASGLLCIKLPPLIEPHKKMIIKLQIYLSTEMETTRHSFIYFALAEPERFSGHSDSLLNIFISAVENLKSPIVSVNSFNDLIIRKPFILPLKNEVPYEVTLSFDPERADCELAVDNQISKGTLEKERFKPGQLSGQNVGGLTLNIQFASCRTDSYITNLSVNYE